MEKKKIMENVTVSNDSQKKNKKSVKGLFYLCGMYLPIRMLYAYLKNATTFW